MNDDQAPRKAAPALPAAHWFKRSRHVRIRPTPARLRVLEAIVQLGRSRVKCADISSHLALSGAPLPAATIYCVAKEMAQAGLLMRDREDGGLTVYSLAAGI